MRPTEHDKKRDLQRRILAQRRVVRDALENRERFCRPTRGQMNASELDPGCGISVLPSRFIVRASHILRRNRSAIIAKEAQSSCLQLRVVRRSSGAQRALGIDAHPRGLPNGKLSHLDIDLACTAHVIPLQRSGQFGKLRECSFRAFHRGEAGCIIPPRGTDGV